MTEIRKIWSGGGDNNKADYWQGRWNFVVVDVVENVMGTNRPRKYWNDLKKSLKSGNGGEGDWKFQVFEKIGQLKIEGSDGKRYLMDVANLETTLRIIQLLLNKTTTYAENRQGNSSCYRLVIKEAQKPGPRSNEKTV